MTSPGATVTSRKTSPMYMLPWIADAPYLRPGTRPSTRNRPSRPTRMPGHELAPRQDALVGGRLRIDAAEVVQRQAPAGLAILVDDAAGDDAPGLEPDGQRAGLVPLEVDEPTSFRPSWVIVTRRGFDGSSAWISIVGESCW